MVSIIRCSSHTPNPYATTRESYYALVLLTVVFFFILNIIGLGAGPWTVGMVSDLLAPTLGVESLRYSMLYVLPPISLWSIVHFYLAGRTLREDLAAAPD